MNAAPRSVPVIGMLLITAAMTLALSNQAIAFDGEQDKHQSTITKITVNGVNIWRPAANPKRDIPDLLGDEPVKKQRKIVKKRIKKRVRSRPRSKARVIGFYSGYGNRIPFVHGFYSGDNRKSRNYVQGFYSGLRKNKRNRFPTERPSGFRHPRK